MKLFISEEAMADIRRGSLEEQLVAVREALQEHHKLDNKSRKILATFPNAAVVVEGCGTVYDYVLGDVNKVFTVVSRKPRSDGPVLAEDSVAKAVFEGKRVPTNFGIDMLEGVIGDQLKSILGESMFLKWWAENYPMIESVAWEKKPLSPISDRDHLLNAMECTIGQASEFNGEFQSVRYWLTKWPKSLSERVKSGETFGALIEYVKKIDLFTSYNRKVTAVTISNP